MKGATQSCAYLTLGEDMYLLWHGSQNSNASMSGCVSGFRFTLQTGGVLKTELLLCIPRSVLPISLQCSTVG